MSEIKNNKEERISSLSVNAGPRDGDAWIQRLKEEYVALIRYVEASKACGDDWFQIAANKDGTRFVSARRGPAGKTLAQMERDVLVRVQLCSLRVQAGI